MITCKYVPITQFLYVSAVLDTLITSQPVGGLLETVLGTCTTSDTAIALTSFILGLAFQASSTTTGILGMRSVTPNIDLKTFQILNL